MDNTVSLFMYWWSEILSDEGLEIRTWPIFPLVLSFSKDPKKIRSIQTFLRLSSPSLFQGYVFTVLSIYLFIYLLFLKKCLWSFIYDVHREGWLVCKNFGKFSRWLRMVFVDGGVFFRLCGHPHL